MTLAHWDDVERRRRDVGDMRSWWRDLGGAAGAQAVGVQRVEIDPGARIGPVHIHVAEEEIFYVLGGSGLAWIDGAVHEIGAKDTLVYPADGPAHTLIAGDEGLDVLCFGENLDPALVRLPRAGIVHHGRLWMPSSDEPDPLSREAAAGPLEIPAPTPRPKSIATFEDTDVDVDEVGPYAWTERMLSHGAGAVRSGLRHAVLPPGKDTCPPHWHSAENELFVILEGGGSLRLYDRSGAFKEEHPLRAGHTVARRAGSGVAHMFRAGDEGMTLLPYGQRIPNEIVFYPRSKKAWVAQAFVRFETVDDYWEGELDHGPDG